MKKILFLLLLSACVCKGQDCVEYIKKDIDKYDGKIKYMLSVDNSPIIFIKSINGKDTSYFIRFVAESETVAVGKSGIKILLADGTKIDKPDSKINVNTNSDGGFRYSTMFYLDKKDIDAFSKSRVADFRIYIFDGKIDDVISTKMNEFFNCLKSI